MCSVSTTELLDTIDVIGAFITIIPFTTTVAGLTDQLMMKSILVKQPELETKRVGLLQAESKMCKDRQELQNKLLYELSSSQGDILKNEVFDLMKFLGFGKILFIIVFRNYYKP